MKVEYHVIKYIRTCTTIHKSLIYGIQAPFVFLDRCLKIRIPMLYLLSLTVCDGIHEMYYT